MSSDFAGLGLSNTSLRTLEHIGYLQPSPIQAAFIPVALTGRDCIGQARTGTGKTAAFILPILEQLDDGDKYVQAIVLAPTRELSEQVSGESRRLADGTKFGFATIVGGRPIGPQIDALENGAQIVVGTPGRVIDLINRRALKLGRISAAVLDEADRMLDIGFRPDIERILRACPEKRQTLLLSATMPAPVERLARRYMTDPLRVDLSEDQVVVETIEQYYVTVDPHRKSSLLVKVLQQERPQQVLIFTRTKRGAENLHRRFAGKLNKVAMIHGDLPQRKRDQVIRNLRSGGIRMLIATDVVGRGIDISGISHIVNYDVPEYCDDYIHRVGRTGRMCSDTSGRAITFVTKDQGEHLTSIEKRINTMLPEYRVNGFDAFESGPRRVHVNELLKSNPVDNLDDFGAM